MDSPSKFTNPKVGKLVHLATVLLVLLTHYPDSSTAAAGPAVLAASQVISHAGHTRSHQELSSLEGKRVSIQDRTLKVRSLSGVENSIKSLEAHPQVKLQPIVSEIRREYASGNTLRDDLQKMVLNLVGPVKQYFDVTNRYRRWYQNYVALQKSTVRSMKSPLEVLQAEYAKVDERLAEEACLREDAKPSDSENVDFVYAVLVEVIDKLEEQLVELAGYQVTAWNLTEVRPEFSNSQPDSDEALRVERSMERLKKSITKKAYEVLQNEMMTLVKIAATDMFASYVQTQQALPNTSGVFTYLAPVMGMIGSASTPLIVSYLRNVEFRTAMTMLRRMNPVGVVKCRLGLGNSNAGNLGTTSHAAR